MLAIHRQLNHNNLRQKYLYSVPMKYRSDIDGLRAIAVVPVVLFHAGYSWIPGGFVGVDIFFVISGYLISSIILNELTAGKFSFARFYERRARRIIPALLVVLVATLAAGYFFLLPDEYASLSQATLAALTFVPNIYFWNTESTYFGLDIATQPLLHTWSLGVEEQFYILFPVLLFFLYRKFSHQTMSRILIALFVLSLATNILLADLYTKYSFYMLPTRAWELLAGIILSLGILPVIRHHRIADMIALVGLALIIGTMLMLQETSVFPGVNAVYPVLGAALIIYSGAQVHTVVARLLSHKALVFIGLVSYSFYLWHWPVTVYTKMVWDSDLNKLFILILSFVLAAVSYRFIEPRYRKSAGRLPRVRTVGELGIIGVFLASCAAFILYSQGLIGRVPNDIMQIAQVTALHQTANSVQCRRFIENNQNDENDRGQLCRLGKQDSVPQFIIWGDSHAEAISYALHLAALDTGVSGYALVNGGCRPLLGVFRKRKEKCLNFNNAVLEFIKNSPAIKHIFLAGYWRISLTGQSYDNSNFLIMDEKTRISSPLENRNVFRRGLKRTLDALDGYRISIIEDVPEIGAQFGKSVANHFIRQAWLGSDILARRTFVDDVDSYDQEFSSALSSLPAHWNFIEVKPWLCQDQECPILIDGKLVYSDGDHLSRYGASLLVPVFRQSLNDGALEAPAKRSARADAVPIKSGAVTEKAL